MEAFQVRPEALKVGPNYLFRAPLCAAQVVGIRRPPVQITATENGDLPLRLQDGGLPGAL
jgi:hypothetical protein